MDNRLPEDLYRKMRKMRIELADIIRDLKMENLHHTQEALNWIDQINRLSVEF